MTYLLRNVPDGLWRQFHDAARAAKRPMREVLLALVRAYVDGAVEVSVPPATRARREQR